MRDTRDNEPDAIGAKGGASSSSRIDSSNMMSTQAGAAAPNPKHQPYASSPEHAVLGNAQLPMRTNVDSVTTTPAALDAQGPARSVPRPATGGEPSAMRMPAPAFGGGLSVPSSDESGSERSPVGGRSPARPGQGASARSSVRMPEGGPGITGGRPVPAPQGRSSGGIPKGTVVGAGEAEGQGATRPPVTGAGPAGQPVGRPGAVPGRASSAPRSGVSGGSAQQQERAAGARSVSSGAAAERGGVSGGRPVVGNAGGGAHGGGRPPRAAQKGRSGREGGGRGPGYLVEDEETWLREDPRVVPPVIE